MLVHTLESEGYFGARENYDAVESFVQKNFDELRHKGEPVDLRAVFEEWELAGSPWNDAWLKGDPNGSSDRRSANGKPNKAIDIQVGRDRLADDPTGGFRNFGHMAREAKEFALSGTMPERLERYQKAALSTYSGEVVGVDGGFAVPEEFATTIRNAVNAPEGLLQRTDMLMVSSNNRTEPVDETTPWQTSGGILAYWEGETGTITQSKLQLKQRTLKLRKLTALVPASDELLEDGVGVSDHILTKAGEKLRWKADEAIIRGTGAGQPLGFLNAGSFISVAKESSQPADTIKGLNIIKMWSRLYTSYRPGAIWLAHPDTEPQLAQLFIQGRTDAGTAIAAGSLMYQPADAGLSTSPFGTLLGRPLIPTQHCDQLGDANDIMLISLGQYRTIAKTGLIKSQASIHFWFDQNTTAFRFVMRVDGHPWSENTISPRDGSNTMSAFIGLAERA